MKYAERANGMVCRLPSSLYSVNKCVWVRYSSFVENLDHENKSFLINDTAAAAAKSLQLCLTLCNPIDGSPPGSPVPGILQARMLEWVAISFSNAGKWKVKVKWLSHVWLFATPWTAAHQAPLSMGFSRQEYWSGLPLPSPSMILAYSKEELPELIFWYPFAEKAILLLNYGRPAEATSY